MTATAQSFGNPRLPPAARWAPGLQLLRTYSRPYLRADMIAGATLAAYLLPSGLGDATLANLPPEAGLYACLFSGLVFWIFCSSRHTAITVTSAISLLIGATLGEFANGDPMRYRALAAFTALLVAAMAGLAWLLSAGTIVNFISESVMVGFKSGVALFIASTQLPKLFGFKGSHGGFWEQCGYFIRHLHDTHPTALLVGGIALAVLLLGKIFFKNRPVALGVVIAGIAVGAIFHLDSHGVALLGSVPHGLPRIGLPAVHWSDANDIFPLALACFMLAAVETSAIGRTFIAKHGGRLDNNQELLALSAANFAAGLGQGLPVSGGMSQSVVNESAGARTPLSGFIAAIVILLVTIFLSGLLKTLPQPVLAAIVLAAVSGLFKPEALKELWHMDRTEFATASAALLGVLTSGLLRGVLIGAVISLVQLLRRASHPHVAVLGRIPGTRRFSDFERHPDNVVTNDVMIFRPESGLVYFNVDHVRESILHAVHAAPHPPACVVLDLSASPIIDYQSVEALASLADELAAEGIRIHAVEARSGVRDRIRSAGADTKLGGINRFSTVADVLDELSVANSTVKNTSPAVVLESGAPS